MTDDPIGNVARGWGRAAEASVTTPRFDLGTAIWVEEGLRPVEVAAQANAATHSLAFTWSRLEADVDLDGRRIFSGVAPVGACNLVQPGQRPRGVLKGPWRLSHLYLPDTFLRRLSEEEGFGQSAGAFEFANPRWTLQPVLWRIARDVAAEMAAERPLGRLKMDALGLLLAVELLRGFSTVGPGPVRPASRSGGLAPWQVKRACDAMDARIGDDISLAELAGVVGLSQTHFSRAFKQAVGCAPFQWLGTRRVERAQSLMLTSELSLAEIALAVGFSAQPAFTTAFRRATGVAPGRWRRDRSAPILRSR